MEQTLARAVGQKHFRNRGAGEDILEEISLLKETTIIPASTTRVAQRHWLIIVSPAITPLGKCSDKARGLTLRRCSVNDHYLMKFPHILTLKYLH